jgi:hypothetical protein
MSKTHVIFDCEILLFSSHLTNVQNFYFSKQDTQFHNSSCPNITFHPGLFCDAVNTENAVRTNTTFDKKWKIQLWLSCFMICKLHLQSRTRRVSVKMYDLISRKTIPKKQVACNFKQYLPCPKITIFQYIFAFWWQKWVFTVTFLHLCYFPQANITSNLGVWIFKIYSICNMSSCKTPRTGTKLKEITQLKQQNIPCWQKKVLLPPIHTPRITKMTHTTDESFTERLTQGSCERLALLPWADRSPLERRSIHLPPWPWE